jgi:hypothetical protein
METIIEKMKSLRLNGAVASLESRNRYALDNKCSYLEFLEMLVEDECVRRKNTGFDRKLKTSRLDPAKRWMYLIFAFNLILINGKYRILPHADL